MLGINRTEYLMETKYQYHCKIFYSIVMSISAILSNPLKSTISVDGHNFLGVDFFHSHTSIILHRPIRTCHTTKISFWLFEEKITTPFFSIINDSNLIDIFNKLGAVSGPMPEGKLGFATVLTK